MAQKMDHGSLVKLGYEALASLEESYASFRGTKREHYARKGRPNSTPARQLPTVSCHYHYQTQEPLVSQVDPASATDQEVVKSQHAMMMHDGLLILDYSQKKSTAMAY